MKSMLSSRPLATGRRALAVTALAVALAGCGAFDKTAPPPDSPPPRSGSDTDNGVKKMAGFAQFSDIAVPAGAKMDVDRTLVLGQRDEWIGRLALSTSDGATRTYDFFLREMPKFGWQEITTVRSEVSVLTYARGGRIATVQIRPKTLGGSLVDVTVSPRGRPGAGASSGGGAAMSPGGGSVTSRPLR